MRDYRDIIIDIDLKGVCDRDGFHEKMRENMPLPSWYGNNLDALSDVLSEHEELTVRLFNVEDLPESYRDALRRMSDDMGGRLCVM